MIRARVNCYVVCQCMSDLREQTLRVILRSRICASRMTYRGGPLSERSQERLVDGLEPIAKQRVPDFGQSAVGGANGYFLQADHLGRGNKGLRPIPVRLSEVFCCLPPAADVNDVLLCDTFGMLLYDLLKVPRS